MSRTLQDRKMEMNGLCHQCMQQLISTHSGSAVKQHCLSCRDALEEMQETSVVLTLIHILLVKKIDALEPKVSVE